MDVVPFVPKELNAPRSETGSCRWSFDLTAGMTGSTSPSKTAHLPNRKTMIALLPVREDIARYSIYGERSPWTVL